ncbi:MAG: hypothetical protein WCO56_14545 [Verrucomicrobiota bacterium]
MRICTTWDRKNGRALAFTLVDVLVSIWIFGLGFISLYTGLASGVQIIGMARENLRATQIMAEKMETMRLYAWEQVTSSTNVPPTFVDYYYPTTLNASHGVVYYGSVTVTNPPFSASYSDDLRMVVIQVSWTNYNIPHDRQMSTMVGRNGLQNYIF